MKHLGLASLVIMTAVFIPGCFHQTDDEVINNAFNVHNVVAQRYSPLLNAPDDESIAKAARQFGSNNRLAQWSFAGLWHGSAGNDYLTIAEGAPLHRATYFIEGDLASVNRQLGYLESRMLFGIPLYSKLRDLVTNLDYVLQAIKNTETYTQEAQYIEDRRLQLAQIAQNERQNRLLYEATHRKPVIVQEIITCQPCKKPVVVTEVKTSCGPCEKKVMVEETVVREKKNKKNHKKKHDKEEIVIDIDKIKGKKARIAL